jgi:hypothetical protein
VVPALSVDQQAQIADAPSSDGVAALALEREIQRGALGAGKPFLNPLH